jgi:hypothetical protein
LPIAGRLGGGFTVDEFEVIPTSVREVATVATAAVRQDD